jgi:outer membrane protein TolC
VDEPPVSFAVEPQDSLVARALRANNAVRAAEREVAAVRAEARGASWDALPQVDVVGSIGGNALSGTPRVVVFGSDTLRTNIEEGDLGDAWSQALAREFPTWSVGVDVTLPLFLREGRGERDRLRAEVERAEQELEATRRLVEDLVRANYREMANGTRRLEIARDGVAASIEEIRIALIEYMNGRTTAFEVVRVGADLPRAQQRLSAALVRTARAAAELKRLTSDGFPDVAPEGRESER